MKRRMIQNASINSETSEATKDFLKISVPIVPLSTGVAILPLIGTVDTDRAKLLLEETLKDAVNLQLSHLIMDLSGVMVVDRMVADQIFKIINALKLVGVKTLWKGISSHDSDGIVYCL